MPDFFPVKNFCYSLRAMTFFIMGGKCRIATDIADDLIPASIADITVFMDDVVCMLLCREKTVI
jgi:hypothetical protein